MADAQKLIEFMDAGGSLYIEGANVGTDSNDLLYSYLGLTDQSTSSEGYSLIENVTGAHGTALEGSTLNYMYGSSADYGIDNLVVDDGIPFLQSQDDAVRTVFYDAAAYRSIVSATFFGSMVDGETSKADVMAVYLDFLDGNPVPNISALQSELDFGIQFSGFPESEWLNVLNTGIEVLQISDVLVEGEDFIYEGPTSIELDPMEMVNLEIIQNATVTGFYEGTITFISNDPDTPEFQIALSGSCVQPPVIEVDTQGIEVFLASGESFSEAFTIANTGGYNLNFSVVMDELSRDVSWLSMDHHFNVLSPGSEDEITLTFDTEFLEDDIYSAEITIYHDDPAQTEIVFPVSLNLTFVPATEDLLANQISLKQNYPNPFNPETKITFSANENIGVIELNVYNARGQKIRNLIDNNLPAGTHSIVWNGKDDSGKSQPSGVYLYSLKNKDQIVTRKMILLR